MNVIANNISNAMTTRTPEGGPFRRQMAVFRGEPIEDAIDPTSFGVAVPRVEDDETPFRSVYEPGHPDADADGYVLYPNVNLSMEMIDLVSARRGYEANVALLVSDSKMKQKALEIIQV
jgi:flagellar basal-body rod protein FlgC